MQLREMASCCGCSCGRCGHDTGIEMTEPHDEQCLDQMNAWIGAWQLITAWRGWVDFDATTHPAEIAAELDSLEAQLDG